MNRNLEQSPNFTKGLVFCEFSFCCNNTSTPLASSVRGANLALDPTTPFNRTGVGIITVLLRDKVRYVVTKYSELEDQVSGSDTGGYTSCGPDINDPGLTGAPSPGGTIPSFTVFTRSAAGTKTDFNGQRVSLGLVLKNSTVGV